MNAEAIGAISERLLADIRSHWSDCLAAGLENHSAEAHSAVDQCLFAYFQELKCDASSSNKTRILAAMRGLFSRLDEIAERFGCGLLETDERELIVPLVLEAAEVAGLNLSQFPDADPTIAFRTF